MSVERAGLSDNDTRNGFHRPRPTPSSAPQPNISCILFDKARWISVRSTLKNIITIGFLALTAFRVIAVAQGRAPSLTGSFVEFDRNWTTVQMWQRELATQAALGHKILILPGDGALMPDLGDSTGFTVNPRTLIYPSAIFPASPPQPDNLGMLLTAADQFGMQIYVGSPRPTQPGPTGTSSALCTNSTPSSRGKSWRCTARIPASIPVAAIGISAMSYGSIGCNFMARRITASASLAPTWRR